MKTSIASVVAELPQIWQSRVLGAVGNARIKIIKMGGEGIPPEAHNDFEEMLLVLDGELPLVIEKQHFTLAAGEFCFVPKGANHHVPPGSFGTLLLVDLGE
ncbi:cupin domain-containing protein [Lelliottia amnigena]|uniref:cupin domain-containing protein n=1 Tax=Lelliottia amnigena TaxID=61646 RepID=UPI001F2617F9|nr:cupin domain-containing protein [Lelliottia amnigena]UJD94958.1 cupin domain-containing protein [Lelliottia amnigena]